MSLVSATSENNNQSFIDYILDADNDGSIIDNVAEVISGKKTVELPVFLGNCLTKIKYLKFYNVLYLCT